MLEDVLGDSSFKGSETIIHNNAVSLPYITKAILLVRVTTCTSNVKSSPNYHLAIVEGRNAGKHFPFDKFKRRSAAS